jgi:hypothetical protein
MIMMRDDFPRMREIVRSLPGFPMLRACRYRLRTTVKWLLDEQHEHWGKVVMNRDTRRMVESLQPSRLKVLEISGVVWGKWMQFKDYRSVWYPDYDVCASALPETFDLIIAEQVFEHLLWPYRAGRHIYHMLNPGGHALITTPFLVRVHHAPVDCSRWTELGLKHLLAECGFPLEQIHTGAWGNRACVKANLNRRLKWKFYRPRLHSLRNEPHFPIHVWALAQK